ncbi:MAG: hypothetical protein HPY44_16140 [Armatimonadetes bacterium]|nr:hypothetical protein [Armatimonadota bacterium]
MPGGFPDELSDAACTVHDFNSGELIASGRMDVRFVPHKDRLRVMRVRFTGEFRPDTPDDRSALEQSMIVGFATGSPAHKIEVEQAGRTWVLVVKFEATGGAFAFTGRADPKPKL